MKIAVLSYYSGQVERGVETWAKNLSKYVDNIDIISGRNSYWGFFSWLKVDILVPTNGRIQSLVCRIFCFIFGKPMVVFGHSGPGADDKWNLLCMPNAFVAFSNAQAKWAKKYKLPFTKVLVIHHAVDTEKFTPAKKKPKKKIVLCVAANLPDKRVNLVEEAVSKLNNYQFMAVGKGNKLEVPHSKISDIYKKADVFCFVPKNHEAFGLVFLEALSSNLPVVTIDDEIRREIVGDAGVFVKDPENIDSLSKAIEKAYKANWGNRPREQAMKFSWDKIAQDYKELFNLQK